MGVHWDAAFTRWWPHKEGKKVFSLEHLDCFEFTIEIPAKPPHPQRTARVRVGFSMHCFTNKWPHELTTGIYQNERERRFFDLERYGLSQLLPGIVRTLERRRIYFGNNDNFLTIELPSVLPEGKEYRVFFNLRRYEERGQTALLLVVQSAHADFSERRVHGRGAERIRLSLLLGHALDGTKPRRPA